MRKPADVLISSEEKSVQIYMKSRNVEVNCKWDKTSFSTGRRVGKKSIKPLLHRKKFMYQLPTT